MRVLCDAFWWERGPGANRTVQREFISAWARNFPDDTLIAALRQGVEAPDLPAGVQRAETRLWPHALSNRFELPAAARKVQADITFTHNFAPVSGPSLVFIHDAMFEDHPEWFSFKERLYFSTMLPSARKASAIAASTVTEANRLARLAPWLPAASVTGLGVAEALLATKRKPASIDDDQEFAVVVGRLNVRKNLGTACVAAARSGRVTPERPLYVIGGTQHSGVGAAFPPEAQAAIDSGAIVFLGHITDDELAWMYAHASLVLALSLDEGFDMPSVEAASAGAPLVASDIAVHRETVGAVATFAPPNDADAIARAIDSTWGVRPAPDATRAITERYTWDKAAGALRNAAEAAIAT